MIWWLELPLFGLLVFAAVIALSVRDLIAAVAALTIYSLLVAALLALMGAVDVALTEAALGAGHHWSLAHRRHQAVAEKVGRLRNLE